MACRFEQRECYHAVQIARAEYMEWRVSEDSPQRKLRKPRRMQKASGARLPEASLVSHYGRMNQVTLSLHLASRPNRSPTFLPCKVRTGRRPVGCLGKIQFSVATSGGLRLRISPTAYAVSCNLPPLRGWSAHVSYSELLWRLARSPAMSAVRP